jgi:hypothetical protein
MRSLRICLLAALGAALVAPVWLVKYPPLLDYPNHLARSFVLAHFRDPQFHFREFYSVHWGAYPYLAMDLSLVGLERILPAETAGRVFLSLCLAALPLGVWFFLRQANPREELLALWVLVISYQSLFLEGFLGFYLSLGVCFFLLGLWLRYLARPGWLRWLAALLAATALYFTHLFGFAVAGLIVTTYCLIARERIRKLAPSWLLFLPGAILYLQSQLTARAGHELSFRAWDDKLDSLSTLLHGYSSRLDSFTLAALAACVVWAWWRNRDFRWNARWASVAAIVFAMYWILPVGYGSGWDVDIRVLPVVFALVPAIAQVGRRRRLVAAAAILLFLLRAGNMAWHFVYVQPQLERLAQAFSLSPPGARVLPIVEAASDDPILRPYAHFWAYGVIARGWLSPYLFAIEGQNPLRLNDNVYSPDGFWDLDYRKQPPDWPQVRQEYDYVWAYHVARFAPQLAAIAQPVYQSGDFTLFRVRKP